MPKPSAQKHDLIHHFSQASAVASDCRRFLEQEQYCCSPDEESWSRLHAYLQRLDEFSPEHFQDVRAQACSSSRALQVWNAAWIHCQEVRQRLEERMALLEGAQTPAGCGSDWPEMIPGEDSEASVQDKVGRCDMDAWFCHGIKKKRGNFGFLFHNSGFCQVLISTLHLAILIFFFLLAILFFVIVVVSATE